MNDVLKSVERSLLPEPKGSMVVELRKVTCYCTGCGSRCSVDRFTFNREHKGSWVGSSMVRAPMGWLIREWSQLEVLCPSCVAKLEPVMRLMGDG